MSNYTKPMKTLVRRAYVSDFAAAGACVRAPAKCTCTYISLYTLALLHFLTHFSSFAVVELSAIPSSFVRLRFSGVSYAICEHCVLLEVWEEDDVVICKWKEKFMNIISEIRVFCFFIGYSQILFISGIGVQSVLHFFVPFFRIPSFLCLNIVSFLTNWARVFEDFKLFAFDFEKGTAEC